MVSGPRDADEKQAPFFFFPISPVIAPAGIGTQRNQSIVNTDDEYILKFESLTGMKRHQLNGIEG